MRTLFLILCVTAFAAISLAQQARIKTFSLDSLQKPSPFSGLWRYHDGDNPDWASAGIDDRNWVLASSSLNFRDKNTPPFNGIAWFRTRIFVDSSLVNVPLALSMEHNGASEVYLDGKKLVSFGEIGTPAQTKHFNPQRLPVAFTLTRSGEHLLAVRYADWNAHKAGTRLHEFGGPGFRLAISTTNAAFAFELEQSVGGALAFQSMFMLFVTLGIVHLLFWLYNRRIVSNLLFSIFSISLGFVFLATLMAFISHSPATISFSQRYQPYVVLLCCVSLSSFINSLFGSHGIRFRFIAGYAVLLAALNALNIAGFEKLLVPLFFGIVALETIVLTLRSIIRRVKGAQIIGAGILLFAGFALTAALIALLTGEKLYFNEHTAIGQVILVSLTASIVAVPVSMSAYLAWNFSMVNKRLQQELVQVETLSRKTLQQEEEKQRILQSRGEELEREVEVRTEELRSQKKKSDDLLLNILPAEVAEELKEKGAAEARYYDEVSVLFTDFVDFTKHSERLSPAAIVGKLDKCFKVFDEIIEKHGLEKIKTIGDAYMAVAGLPAPNGQHAKASVQAALDIRDYIDLRLKDNPAAFAIRIGVHSGPVVAGIIGVKKFAYDIWGDTVNTAARIQQGAEPGKVNISQSTYELIKGDYLCHFRGEVIAKNKGALSMYYVESKVPEPAEANAVQPL